MIECRYTYITNLLPDQNKTNKDNLLKIHFFIIDNVESHASLYYMHVYIYV